MNTVDLSLAYCNVDSLIQVTYNVGANYNLGSKTSMLQKYLLVISQVFYTKVERPFGTEYIMLRIVLFHIHSSIRLLLKPS